MPAQIIVRGAHPGGMQRSASPDCLSCVRDQAGIEDEFIFLAFTPACPESDSDDFADSDESKAYSFNLR